jgi:hypothetical protein
MDNEIINTLQQGGVYLYAFKAVGTSSVLGEPVTWFQGNSYSTDTRGRTGQPDLRRSGSWRQGGARNKRCRAGTGVSLRFVWINS